MLFPKRLIAFAPLDELGEFVLEPEKVRENAKFTVVVHSDQIPFLAKIRPGKQLYAGWELQRNKKDRENNVKDLSACRGGGSQVSIGEAKGLGPFDPQAFKEAEGEEGLCHLRGEANENQDKYRITVDVEQVFYNVCDESLPVKAEWGVTSVTIVGKHMDVDNVSLTEPRVWLKDQAFTFQGKEVFYKAGAQVHHQHGKAILDLRKECPELWARLTKAGIKVYQQPAGFEDAVITAWKIAKQAERFPVSVAVKDLFSGGLAETSRHAMMCINQIPAWITGKMGCSLQITDTDVAMRLKAKSGYALARLRSELIKLAEAEETRAIFRCGIYEVVRCLVEAIEELRDEMRAGEDLLKAGRRNGWLAVRPSISQKTFLRCDDEAWAQGMPQGSHRMQKSWIEGRLQFLDENGMPTPVPEGEAEEILNKQAEQTYSHEGAERCLETWRSLLANGDLTQEQLDEMKKEPWFEMEVQKFSHFEGASEEYKNMIKTPKDLRREAGVDENLTSQRRKDVSLANIAKHKRLRDAWKPLRAAAI